MIKSEKENLSTVQKIIVDAGYTGEKFASAIKTIINANGWVTLYWTLIT
ncbi:hypothetical protein SHM_17100 [Spiroplasma ixodetis]|uniref:Transposase n=1 Tax=Spiroplasma ixodetis TaxID=2141 RepID=A0ABN6T1F9_9MOLU|nr:hypothetical protein SHM_17100 [Spiroplasma ixodetis]